MTGFLYLASPYSRYPGGMDSAFRIAAKNAALLIRSGIAIFSPITHTHPIAACSTLDPRDLNIWLPADQPFMEAASGCIMLQMTGWEESLGMAHELLYFTSVGKMVYWMEPGVIPSGLLKQEPTP